MNTIDYCQSAGIPNLVIPSTRGAAWIRHVPLSALLLAGTQVLLERPRWQMFPAYILASLLFLAWLLQNIAPMDLLNEQRWYNRLVTGLLLIGLVALGLAVSIALPIMIPVFRFPQDPMRSVR